ncbi:MAG: alanine racemase, partial [Mucispirillum sp.]|nr:alanine racemase [Mucispirillum sp.]
MTAETIDTKAITRPTYALIDLNRFGSNIDEARRLSKSDIIAVLKADAYGHGAARLAEYAYEEKKVTHFAVATMMEGLELRKHLPYKDAVIIVLGYVTD